MLSTHHSFERQGLSRRGYGRLVSETHPLRAPPHAAFPPQHFLNLLPLPHGQLSLGLALSLAFTASTASAAGMTVASAAAAAALSPPGAAAAALSPPSCCAAAASASAALAPALVSIHGTTLPSGCITFTWRWGKGEGGGHSVRACEKLDSSQFRVRSQG
jgi:hypothetical protein